MDVYDYNDDNLSVIARSCRYMNYRSPGSLGKNAEDVSCRECTNWNGRGCAGNHLDNIVSEMRLD